MKKQNLLLLFVAFIFTINACDQDGVNGEGEIKSESRNVDTFNSINVSVPANIFITQGSTQSLRVETHENVIDIIETYVTDGTLRIYNDQNIRNLKKLNIYITAADFQKLTLSGAASITSEGSLDLNDLNLSVSGASKVNISGNSNSLVINASGASSIRGFNMMAQKVDATISGAGNMKISSESELKVNLTGASSLEYKGNPVITSSVTGASRLVNAN